MGRQPSTFVISITPLADDGSLHEGRARRHFRRMAEAGIGVYVGGSGSGEGYTLDDPSLRSLLSWAVDELKGKVPVRAMGREPRTADEMIRVLSLAASTGVDAVQLYSLDAGHANTPSGAEMERYYDDVLSRIDAATILSTHYSVGYLLPIDLIVALIGRYPQITGVNCTTPDLTYVVQLVDALDESIELHLGGPMLALSALALGASGYLSSEANVAPRLCRSIVDHVVAGRLPEAHDAYERVMRLFTANMTRNAVAAGRLELDLLGLPVGPPRPPRLPLTDPTVRSELAQVLLDLDIVGIEGLDPEPLRRAVGGRSQPGSTD